MCVYVCVMIDDDDVMMMMIMMYVWKSEDNLQEPFSALWTLGIKLRISGLATNTFTISPA